MKPGRAAAFAFLLLLSFSAISFALYGPMDTYKETMIDLSIGRASDDTKVALMVKLYYKDAASGEWIEFADPPTIIAPAGPCGSQLCDFYVYRGMKSGDDLREEPLPAQRAYQDLATDTLAWQNVDTGKHTAKIEIPKPPSDDCFRSVIYWGYEEETSPGVYDKTKSYQPAVATIPACGTGGIITLNSLFPTTDVLKGLCLPLVLLLGLLMASMYVQGKNVLAGFDFSAPRASGGRQYMMRKGGSVNAWGTVLFNAISFGATQAAQVQTTKADIK